MLKDGDIKRDVILVSRFIDNRKGLVRQGLG